MSVGDDGGGGAPTTERRPLGTVLASAVEGVRTLARQRLDLAKIELAGAAAVRAKGIGMMAGAAVVVVYAIAFVFAAAAAALALVWPVWLAILTVAILMIVVALMLVMIGRRMMRTAPPAGARTRETLKEDARWATQQIGR